MCKSEVIIALLTIRKAKSYWNQVSPPQYWTSSDESFREQLLLAIGRFYSQQNGDSRYHIPYLLESLHKVISTE